MAHLKIVFSNNFVGNVGEFEVDTVDTDDTDDTVLITICLLNEKNIKGFCIVEVDP